MDAEKTGALCQCGVGAAEGVTEVGSQGEGSWGPRTRPWSWRGRGRGGLGQPGLGRRVACGCPGAREALGEKRLEGEAAGTGWSLGALRHAPTDTDGVFLLQQSLPLLGGWVCPFLS